MKPLPEDEKTRLHNLCNRVLLEDWQMYFTHHKVWKITYWNLLDACPFLFCCPTRCAAWDASADRQGQSSQAAIFSYRGESCPSQVISQEASFFCFPLFTYLLFIYLLSICHYGADEPGVLYLSDTTALYRVPLQTGVAEKIADLAKLNVRGGQPFSRTANGSFVFADRSYDVPVLAALCPGTSGGKQKSVLTLATVNPGGQTIAQVREFNRSNSDYQVEILDFSSLLDSGSYMDLFTTWNTAIAAGDTPDMIDFSNLPWHSFADRGMLLDLNTILPQEDILPWLWKSVSYHGANYTFPGCFTVETLVGKQLKLGDRQHWTVQEFFALADSSDISMFSGMSRELFLFYMEQYLLDAFLDEETKTCSFDSEEFRSLLDYAATLAEPEELGFEVENSMLLIRRDLALAEPVILSNIGQMHSAESYTVGEPLAWIGWPGPNGTKIRPDAEIAVFKNTDHTDGAAAFLQFLLSDTSQTVLGRFAFPMTVSAFESEIAAAMEARNTNDPDLATEFTVDGTVYRQ